MRKKEMRIKKRKLKLRAMGISNWCMDKETRKLYSLQFYDYDYDGKPESEYKKDITRIMEIFPYDCIMYSTKHGIQFFSFSILKGLRITKSRAVETSKGIDNQNYWSQSRDLTLRVSPKWKTKRFKKTRLIISKKPKFKGFIKEPNKYIISEKHLEFYHKFMNLPDWVYFKYKDCDKRDFKIKIHHYKTRD